MYIQVLINNAVKHAHGEFIFEKAKMKIAGEWENGKILKCKWIFPNGTYFEGPFINNFPKDEGVWYFTNWNIVKGSFSQGLKDNQNPEENAEVGEDCSQIIVITFRATINVSPLRPEMEGGEIIVALTVIW